VTAAIAESVMLASFWITLGAALVWLGATVTLLARIRRYSKDVFDQVGGWHAASIQLASLLPFADAPPLIEFVASSGHDALDQHSQRIGAAATLAYRIFRISWIVAVATMLVGGWLDLHTL
jgi:hypothetical protein